MYHNFTFVENDTTHFLQWNPTSVEFGKKTRTLFQPLDGPPIMHYQDTTEVIGTLYWDNIPVKWRSPYKQIEDLVGKTGVIYTNLMPQLVGTKNVMYNSHLGDPLNSIDWIVGCLGTFHEDSSVLGPDGIHLAHLYKTDSASTNAGCFVAGDIPGALAEHNVLSCYIKYGGSPVAGINLYQVTPAPQSRRGYFEFSSGGSVLSKHSSDFIDDYGFYKVPNTDDWFRVWTYVNGGAREIIGGTSTVYLYPNINWSSSDVVGTYMTDIQYEQGVTKPTWFAQTQEAQINEPLLVEFLDMQTDYLNNPGVVKHRVSLNFKLIGGWL